MKSKIYIFLFLLLGLFGINLILPIHAASTQWFPDNGTKIEYDISSSTTFVNYSQRESKTFNIYYDDYFAIIPTYMDTIFPVIPSAWNLNASNAKVTFLVNYIEKSPTELYRNIRLKVDDEILSDINTYLIMIRLEGGFFGHFFPIFSNFSFAEKLDFFPHASGAQFLDYFNCTLGVGASIPFGLEILTVTSNQIIAARTFTGGNETYVADRRGKVQSFSVAYNHSSMLDIGYRSINFLFTARESTTNGSIPGFDLYLIYGILGILTVVLISKSKNKS